MKRLDMSVSTCGACPCFLAIGNNCGECRHPQKTNPVSFKLRDLVDNEFPKDCPLPDDDRLGVVF